MMFRPAEKALLALTARHCRQQSQSANEAKNMFSLSCRSFWWQDCAFLDLD